MRWPLALTAEEQAHALASTTSRRNSGKPPRSPSDWAAPPTQVRQAMHEGTDPLFFIEMSRARTIGEMRAARSRLEVRQRAAKQALLDDAVATRRLQTNLNV